jgi:hypothetical protein
VFIGRLCYTICCNLSSEPVRGQATVRPIFVPVDRVSNVKELRKVLWFRDRIATGYFGCSDHIYQVQRSPWCHDELRENSAFDISFLTANSTRKSEPHGINRAYIYRGAAGFIGTL